MLTRWLLVLGLCCMGLVWQACGMSEDSIKQEIEKARACTTDAECANVASKCPFGCNVTVNQKDAEYIRGLVDGFQSNCQYDCVALDKIVCQNSLCTALTKP